MKETVTGRSSKPSSSLLSLLGVLQVAVVRVVQKLDGLIARVVMTAKAHTYPNGLPKTRSATSKRKKPLLPTFLHKFS